MKLQEYQAHQVFSSFGIPVQPGVLIRDPSELADVKLRYPLVLKAQVLAGGRGKAGGIQVAVDPQDAQAKAEQILSMSIKGIPVRQLFVVEKAQIEKEYYVSFVLDRRRRRFVLVASQAGGVDVEETASTSPERIYLHEIDPFQGFSAFEGRWTGKAIGLGGKLLLQFADIAVRLYQILVAKDAELVEVNPLALTPTGFCAVDAKMIIDSSALYRQAGYVETEELTLLERQAKDCGFSYVELDGEVGVIGCGAGLVMATLDAVHALGARPANFLDLGGGANAAMTRKGLEIVLANPRVRSVFINIFGGITHCDEIAKGIVEFASSVPLAVRMTGTHEQEGIQILREGGYEAFDSMEEAARRAVQLAQGRH